MRQKAKIAELDLDRLQEVLDYDPGTGVFTWLKMLSPRGVRGSRAGAQTTQGYRRIGIDGLQYFEHDLAWLFHYGEPPERELDHRNLVKSDNFISNLRSATRAQNAQNMRASALNTSGFKGVCKCSGGNRYRASIRLNGQRLYLGSFATPEDAHAAYAKKAKELHGEFARTD